MIRKTPYQNTFLVYGAVCTAVLIISITVTFLNTAGTITHLDGIIGRIDHGNLWNALDPISNLIYSVGDYCCHQEADRSLVFNGNQMPICIRETFLFLGMALGFLVLSTRSFLPAEQRFVLCTILILFTPLEWGMEHYLDVGSSLFRAIVSVMSGFAFAGFMSAILEKEYVLLTRKN